MFGDWTTQIARDFLKAYPTPDALTALRPAQWRRFARAHRLSEARTTALWEQRTAPQGAVPAHVVRTKARLLATLLTHMEATHQGVESDRAEIERVFATRPAAKWMQPLPGGQSGTTVPTRWAELGDAPGRWTSWQHLQAQAGSVPVTVQSGTSCVVRFRFACNHARRHAVHWPAFCSLQHSTSPRPTICGSGREAITTTKPCGPWGRSG